MIVDERHMYLDARTFIQNGINGPDAKFFHDHAGNDMALDHVQGSRNWFW